MGKIGQEWERLGKNGKDWVKLFKIGPNCLELYPNHIPPFHFNLVRFYGRDLTKQNNFFVFMTVI